MSITIHDHPQRSPEWFQARLGRLTGSCAADMLATIKSGEAAARRDLRLRLVVERLTGQVQDDGFISKDMQRGIDKEVDAFAAYEALTGRVVRRTGFIAHNELMVGCSLDGDVNNLEGIIELKVPKSATHLRYLKDPVALPREHSAQVTHNLWVTGAKWCDFLSFDDRFPPSLQTFLVRWELKPAERDSYELMVRQFLREVDAEVEAVKALAKGEVCA